MRYLVDAYNLLFRKLKKRGSLEKSRQHMIEELNDAVSHLKLQITLIFDGAEEYQPHPSRGHFDAIELVYTPKRKTADEYISDEVINSKSPSQIIVVTNDRELAIRCRIHRAKTQTIDEFIAFVSKKRTKKKKIPSSSERIFRESNSELARLLIIFEKKMLEKINRDFEDI
jgi:predicted RNA-binding protein with PIN domain